MLGADVGTSLVTVILSFDLSWLAPLLIFVGVTLFLAKQSTNVGRFGRILIGLGLIIFALQWISVAAKPFVQAAGVKVIFASLTGDVLLDMLVAALFTILCYSSLAVVLLMATLASLSMISLPVALGLVLGANLGSGILGMLSTLRSPPEARRVTLGNFLFKLIGCVLAIPTLKYVEGWVAGLELDPAREVVLFHFFFNIALALLFIFWTEKIARVAERLLPNKPLADDPAKPRNLDPSALDTPPLAIANAAREAMRIGDVVEDMLNGMLHGHQDQRPRPRRSACARRTTSSTTCTRRSSSTSPRSRARRWTRRKAGAGPTSSRSPSTSSRSATSSSAC